MECEPKVLPIQAKLLRALQKREIDRAGGTSSIPVDIRLIAASNRDLDSDVPDGEFREDLVLDRRKVLVFEPDPHQRSQTAATVKNAPRLPASFC
ncbi:MAG: hypothetical protein DMG13_19020 [Acidobacteria bacterium]|nr:MAG: hypothetical protein DMG13_19020 [Acidobacteriota bacterium]